MLQSPLPVGGLIGLGFNETPPPPDQANKSPTIWYFPKIREPQYRPQNTIVLNIGTPKKVPLILGNPHKGLLIILGVIGAAWAGHPLLEGGGLP